MMINTKFFLNISSFDKNIFLRIILLFSVFIISLILGNLYVGGDNNGYRAIYNGIAGVDIVNAYYLYNYVITTSEFVHFIFVWIASNLGIDRIFFLSMCNTLFAGILIKIFDNLKVNFLVTSFFILTNYYLYVVFFAGERLKFGFIFFLLFFLFRKKYVLSFFFFGLSIFSHLQMLILCSGRALQLFINEVKPLLFKLQFKWSLLLVLPIIVFALFAINTTQISGLPYLVYKITAYGGDRSLFDFLRMTIFFLIALYYTKDRSETLIYFLPLFIAVYFVGGDRMNMIGYIFCLYYCLPYRAGLNLGVLITNLYFLYANIDFVSKIILYGNGFPPQP